jgi:hypothetical protein
MIVESIYMRREIIKSNYEIMGERLDEEFNNCKLLKEKWDTGNKDIVEKLDKIKIEYNKAKCFYDLTLML